MLVLDEPTNHLDLEAIEALVEGLRSLRGHSAAGLPTTAGSSRSWRIASSRSRNRGFNDFRGTYDEYVERCGDDHLDVEQAVLRAKREKKKERGDTRPSQAEDRKRQRRARDLKRDGDRLTRDIEKAEERIAAINEDFCNPGFFDRTRQGGA